MDSYECRHSEIDSADQTFCFRWAQYTDTTPTIAHRNLHVMQSAATRLPVSKSLLLLGRVAIPV